MAPPATPPAERSARRSGAAGSGSPSDPGAYLPSVGEPRARGIGLRGQIMFALVTGLALAVALVGVAIDRLAARAIDVERARTAEVAARSVAAIVGRVDAPPLVLERAERALLRADAVIGIEIHDDQGREVGSRGETTRGLTASAPIEGGTVRVRVSSGAPDRGDGAGRALMQQVVLYAGATSLGILILCYVLLTRLIVRPVEELTRASEKLASGREGAIARVHGAAEVQQLALAFNAMARDLRADRATLEHRLRELEAATRELRATQDSLARSEKLASVGRLAAGIAHEIGNPIAAILGLLELVRAGGLEAAEEAEFLRRIQHETERISRIIRDLLDYSRADSVTASCDLGEVVESAVHLVAPQKDLRRITIERRVPGDLPAVRGDADRLTQVVLNLLLNAADAIEGDGAIAIEIEAHDQTVDLAISDTGPGIAPEVRGTLFEPFVTTKPAGSGTGLGLAVCWQIVDRLGGTITAEDAPSGGARFVVRIPIARPRDVGSPASA
jgi:two-component system NtrC family sensor kinase